MCKPNKLFIFIILVRTEAATTTSGDFIIGFVNWISKLLTFPKLIKIFWVSFHVIYILYTNKTLSKYLYLSIPTSVFRIYTLYLYTYSQKYSIVLFLYLLCFFIYLNLYFHFFALMSRLIAALSSETQHAMPPEFVRKWGTEYLLLLCLPCCVRDTAWSW